MSATEQPGVTIPILHPPDSGQHAGSRKNLFSPMHMLHRPSGSNPHKWFKYDDGEITEAEMYNNEMCICVISVSL